MVIKVLLSAVIVLMLNSMVLVYIGEYHGIKEALTHKAQLVILYICVYLGLMMIFTNDVGYSNLLLIFGVLVMVLMAFIDYQTMILPDTLNAMLLIAVLVGKYLKMDYFARVSWKSGLIGMMIGFGVFLFIAVVTRGAMGGGDIKLMAVLGLWFGAIDIWIVTLLSFVLGAVISVGLLILKIKGRKDMIPFGPFIILSALLVLFFRDSIVGMYLKIM